MIQLKERLGVIGDTLLGYVGLGIIAGLMGGAIHLFVMMSYLQLTGENERSIMMLFLGSVFMGGAFGARYGLMLGIAHGLVMGILTAPIWRPGGPSWLPYAWAVLSIPVPFYILFNFASDTFSQNESLPQWFSGGLAGVLGGAIFAVIGWSLARTVIDVPDSFREAAPPASVPATS